MAYRTLLAPDCPLSNASYYLQSDGFVFQARGRHRTYSAIEDKNSLVGESASRERIPGGVSVASHGCHLGVQHRLADDIEKA